MRSDILDWHGDHPHTNYKDMYNFLIDAGYYLEVRTHCQELDVRHGCCLHSVLPPPPPPPLQFFCRSPRWRGRETDSTDAAEQ